MTALATVFASARPKFLVLAPLCVALGLTATMATGFQPSLSECLLILLAALSAHIAVNSLNEYQDFTSGLDAATERTPFSGGSGALPDDPDSAPLVLAFATLNLMLATAIGLYFISQRGVTLLPIGVIGIVIIITYTRLLNTVAWACLIAPGTGFGLLMVPGTAIALTGENLITAWCLAIPAFFLVNGLLLLNQMPDVEADAQAGRNHWAIRFGKASAARVYLVFMVLAYASIAVPVLLGMLPVGTLLAMLTLFIAAPTVLGVLRHAASTPALTPYMGLNVVVTVTTLGLLSIGMLIPF